MAATDAAGRAAIALGVPLEHDALVVLATTALAFISFPFAVALVK